MKSAERDILLLAASVLVILFTATAGADVPVRATQETTGISSMTNLDCEGTVTQANSLTWQQSSSSLHDPPLIPGGIYTVWFDSEGNPVYGWTADPEIAELLGEPVPQGEVRYTASYTGTTLAAQGTTRLTRMVDLDSGNMAGNQKNIDITTQLAFSGGAGVPRVSSEEDLIIDASGAHTTAAGSMLCPFASSASPFIPPFCNIVQVGSLVDLSHGSVLTTAATRFVSGSGESPVTADYAILGEGEASSGGYPHAAGSMNAYIHAHILEGSMREITPGNPDAVIQPEGFVPMLSGEFTYTESSSATGSIGLFFKEMHYRSGILQGQ